MLTSAELAQFVRSVETANRAAKSLADKGQYPWSMHAVVPAQCIRIKLEIIDMTYEINKARKQERTRLLQDNNKIKTRCSATLIDLSAHGSARLTNGALKPLHCSNLGRLK